jgi:hypothetical protein
VLGIRIPWRIEGKSIFDPAAQIPSSVVVYERSGRPLTLSLPEFKRRIRASLGRKIRLFGSNGRRPGLYGIGPHPELIGRTVADLPRAHVGATINGPDAYSSVHLRSDFVPAQLSGTIKASDGQPNRDLAVALNGRIVAVGRSFHLNPSDPEHFSVMLPDSAFHEGSNRVELLAVPGDAPSLSLIAQAG